MAAARHFSVAPTTGARLPLRAARFAHAIKDRADALNRTCRESVNYSLFTAT
jgi:hypothetical protein